MMRGVLANKVRRDIAKLIKGKEPFLVENRATTIPRGFRLFTYEVNKNFLLFIMLKIHDLKDEYTLEFGWGKYDDEHIPDPTFSDKKLSVEEWLQGVLRQEEANIEIGSLRAPQEKAVPWYYLGQAYDDPFIDGKPATPIKEAMVNLEDALEDTERILDQYVYPLFKKLLQIHGINNQ